MSSFAKRVLTSKLTVISAIVICLIFIVFFLYKEFGNKIPKLQIAHDLVVVETPYPLVVSSNDDYQGSYLIKHKKFKENIAYNIQRILKPGDRVIDIGAGYGYHTLYMSKAVGKEGRVFSIEYNHEVAKILGYNKNLNKMKNVSIVEALPYSSSMAVLLNSPQPTINKMQFIKDKHYIADQVYHTKTLDMILAGLSDVAFINMNTFGTELEIIRGSLALISKSPKLTIAFTWNRDNIQQYSKNYKKLMQELQLIGFEFFIVQPDGKINEVSLDKILFSDTPLDIILSKDRI